MRTLLVTVVGAALLAGCGIPKAQYVRDIDLLKADLQKQQQESDAAWKAQLDASQERIKTLEAELDDTQAEQERIKTRAAVTRARSWLLQAQVAVMDKRFRDAVFASELARTAIDRLALLDSELAKGAREKLEKAMPLVNKQDKAAAVSLGAAAQALAVRDSSDDDE